MKYCNDCEEILSDEDDEYYCECTDEPFCFDCYEIHQDKHELEVSKLPLGSGIVYRR